MQATTSQAVPVAPRTALPWGARFECTSTGADVVAESPADSEALEPVTITLDVDTLRRVREFVEARRASDAAFAAWDADRKNQELWLADDRAAAKLRTAAVSVAIDISLSVSLV